MHRVASRQRLFSWDHFDAHAINTSDSDNESITTVPDVPLIIDASSNFGDDTSTATATDTATDTAVMTMTLFPTADENPNDDLSDYRTCISMSRHNSMIFNQRSLSFGKISNCGDVNDANAIDHDDDDDDNDNDHIVSVVSHEENEELNQEGDVKDSHCQIVQQCNTKPTMTNNTTTMTPTLVPTLVPTSVQVHLPMPSEFRMFAESSLFQLNQDVHLSILSFLDLNSLRSVTLTCRYFWILLTEPFSKPIGKVAHVDTVAHVAAPNSTTDATTTVAVTTTISHDLDMQSRARNAIWWNIMKQSWPFLSLDQHDYNDPNTNTNTTIEFVTNECKKYNKPMNYGALLTQSTQESPPTSIDPSFFNPSSTIQTQTFHVHNNVIVHRYLSTTPRQLFQKYELNVKKDDLKSKCYPGTSEGGDDDATYKLEVVQFIGNVGVGDRSIRSNSPFPRPLESLPCFKHEKSASDMNCDNTTTGTTTTNCNTTSHRFSERCSNSFFSSSTRGRKRSLSLSNSNNHHQEDNDSSSDNSSTSSMTSMPRNILNRLKACACDRRGSSVGAVIKTASWMKANNTKLPFVSPIVVSKSWSCNDKEEDEGEYIPQFKRYLEIDLTPKLMAYFEVTILARDIVRQEEVEQNDTLVTRRNYTRTAFHVNDDNNNDDNDGDNDGEELDPRSSACIAIGLSMKDYSSSVRMPGWDDYSYGYHGDDGGIFHSKGDKLRVYGPKYGAGDCVGCGVNYANGGIFFTLNGDFLGYAWCNEKVVLGGKDDLYPTIGVDAPNPLACNFGNERPFVFDFAKFVATQDSL